MGVNLAKEVAISYKLPDLNNSDDVLDYNVSKTIDLTYRMGILSRPEWRRMHRCYEIRRDLEHEDNEYEAVLEDCFYIFKSAIDIVLSKDPIELLTVVDVKQIVENPTSVSLSEEFLHDYKSAPFLRQKEINQLLISFAHDDSKPDIVRENSVEVMRKIKSITLNTVIIEIAAILEAKLGRNGLDLKTAKIANASGAIAYFKKDRLKDFFTQLLQELEASSNDWHKQWKICSKIEDIGGLGYCPKAIYNDLLKWLVTFYIGEPSYGTWRNYRPVFYSNAAAPIIARIIKNDAPKVATALDELRKDKDIKLSIGNTHISRRFETLVDLGGQK